MAQRLVQLSPRLGPAALCAVAGLIAAAFVGVLMRADGAAWRLGPGDLSAIRFTLLQSALSALCSVALAVPVARALARRSFAGRGAVIALLGAPFILPVIVGVFGLLAIFGRAGLISTLIGSPVQIYGLWGVVLAHVFFNLPLATRLLLQGWADLPAERFRLSAQLGLSTADEFRRIEWPMLRRLIPGACAVIFAVCLTSFTVALTLGGGPRATTIELAIYQAFRFDFDLGRAAMLSLLQVALAGAAALLAFWAIPNHNPAAGLRRPVQRFTKPAPLMDALWITLACAFLIGPILAVAVNGAPALGDLPASVWVAARQSVTVALASTALLVAIALPMAGWLAARRTSRLEALGLLGLVTSPLTIGTGWFILIHPVADPRAFALPVTAVVNALTALPFALRALVPPLQQSQQELGRLGLSLGLQPMQMWRWAAWPRIRAPLGFSAGLGAAFSMGDLGVIALFADETRATLPLQMYRLMGAYRMDEAAGAALLLLILAFGLFAIFDVMGRRYART